MRLLVKELKFIAKMCGEYNVKSVRERELKRDRRSSVY